MREDEVVTAESEARTETEPSGSCCGLDAQFLWRCLIDTKVFKVFSIFSVHVWCEVFYNLAV